MNGRVKVRLILATAIIVVLGTGFLLFLNLFRSPLEGEKSFDFGVVQIDRPHSVLEHTFSLTNVTDHALKLVDAVPTCGCTTTEWPQEPVGVGEQLEIPIHLKIQRSHHRSSKVRLIFETGEVVVLHIEGTGRFKQPLRVLPPTVKVVNGLKDGSRNMFILEWDELSSPKIPTFNAPKSIRVEPEEWALSTRKDDQLGTPAQWTLQIYTFLDGPLTEGSELIVEMENAPPFHVPIEQVDHLDRPRPTFDPNHPTSPNLR